jgi:hypothetical protein
MTAAQLPKKVQNAKIHQHQIFSIFYAEKDFGTTIPGNLLARCIRIVIALYQIMLVFRLIAKFVSVKPQSVPVSLEKRVHRTLPMDLST